MRTNPYSAAKNRRRIARLKASGEPVTAASKEMPRAVGRTRTGAMVQSGLPLVAPNGEFNIGGSGYSVKNKQDLMMNLLAMANSIQNGTFENVYQVQASEEEIKLQDEMEHLIVAGHSDRSGESYSVLAEVEGDVIYDALPREGFARKTLIYNGLKKGDVARVQLRKHDIMAHISTADPETPPSVVRQLWAMPEDRYITANIRIEDKEIAQSPRDLLDDKHEDGLEAMLVGEDRLWLSLARPISSMITPISFFATLTPTVYSSMRTVLGSNGCPAANCIMAWDLWNDMTADTQFANWWSPIEKHELILTGFVGSVLGIPIHTDGFRPANMRVLSQGEIFMLGDPRTVGVVMDRKAIESHAINGYALNGTWQGWHLVLIDAMIFRNARAINRGMRV